MSVHVSSSLFSCQRAHIFTPTSDIDAGPMSTPPFFPDNALRWSDLLKMPNAFHFYKYSMQVLVFLQDFKNNLKIFTDSWQNIAPPVL
jgi:hypothetical protein